MKIIIENERAQVMSYPNERWMNSTNELVEWDKRYIGNIAMLPELPQSVPG